ncbi:MAG: stage II sporulation protein M [Gammaproteobacteria bacterium]
MKQQDFEKAYGPVWQSFGRWLEDAKSAKLTADQVPGTYRRICHHLALCRARNYSSSLEERLNRLALDGHKALYAARASGMGNLWRFFAQDFPRCVRAHWKLVLVAAIVFYGPFAAMIGAIAYKPALAYSVIPPSQAAQYEQMYSDETRAESTRDSTDDVLMFGFYIYNNISIGFMTFASGALFGIGALYVVFTNGLTIGAVVGHLTTAGYGHNLLPFISGHGSFELNAIVLAGAAGLKLGFSFFAPGRRTRIDALRHAAAQIMPMVYGFTAMLLIAAFIEAFWSSTAWAPALVKYSVAAVLWVFVLGYFLFAGRRRAT